MKVLHVITGLAVGGAELQLRSILQQTRHDAEVVTLYNPAVVADMITGDGNRVRDLGMRSNTELSALVRLRAMIREGGYDVVHTHLYRSCVYGRLAARLAGTPVIVATEHSIGETHLERRKMSPGVRALYLGTERCSQATIAVSDTVRDRLVAWGVPAHKVSVIPNGLDFGRVAFDAAARRRVRAELGIPADGYVIGVLGRLDANKRFDLVIKAAAPLLGDDTKLLITGKGAEGDSLAELVASLGLADRVIFAGERHDVSAVLSALDLFVASSAQETFGLSVLEALANGMPALYTTCPALAGIDTDRAVKVPGDEAGLRTALAAEINGGRRARSGVPAVLERYGIVSVTDQIDNLYERLMAARKPRGSTRTRRTAEVRR